MENGPHLIVTDPTVLDMLYGQNASDFNLFFQEEESFNSLNNLLNQTSQFWLDLFNETFSTPRALVLAYPSIKIHNDMIAEENNRVKKRVSILPYNCTKTEQHKNRLKSMQTQIFIFLHGLTKAPHDMKLLYIHFIDLRSFY